MHSGNIYYLKKMLLVCVVRFSRLLDEDLFFESGADKMRLELASLPATKETKSGLESHLSTYCMLHPF